MIFLIPALSLLLAFAAPTLPAQNNSATPASKPSTPMAQPGKPGIPPTRTWVIVDLGTLAGKDHPGSAGSDAYSINAQGQIVGRSVTASGSVHAFVWNPRLPNGAEGVMTDLGSLPGRDASRAYAIADDGRIVGDALIGDSTRGDSDFEHAFLCAAPVAAGSRPLLLDLDPLGTESVVAWSLGPEGQIAGQWTVGAKQSRAFVWDAAHGFKYLMDASRFSAAYAMNARGWVAGVAEVTPGVRRAVLWRDKTMVNLNTLPVSNQSIATALNAAGQVVCISYMVDPLTGAEDGTSQAYVWQNGHIQRLGQLGGRPITSALAINNKGEIVGEADSGDLNGRPFLWRNGKMTDLNNFLPPNSGWELNGAHGINDSDEIVGYGVHDGGNHAFLLCPLSDPAGSAGK